jgi:hypothetical protein
MTPDPPVGLFCDRCNRRYETYGAASPLCLPCAVASDSAEHQGHCPAPMTLADLKTAYRNTRRRRHLKALR